MIDFITAARDALAKNTSQAAERVEKLKERIDRSREYPGTEERAGYRRRMTELQDELGRIQQEMVRMNDIEDKRAWEVHHNQMQKSLSRLDRKLNELENDTGDMEDKSGKG
jgi:cell fate (sporulation/competence/biofilm development) regulator YmcA (YheA/YmcA/DUF963 family)